MKICTSISLGVLAVFATAPAMAESVIDGHYSSTDSGPGSAVCDLSISSLDDKSKYGDQLFHIESSGDGACEWSAIGVSKSFIITAGSVTSGGAQTFVRLDFPFGPAGKRIQLTAFDADGSIRNEEMFVQE